MTLGVGGSFLRCMMSKVNFTQVPNEVLSNPDLSLKAKGLYSYLISKPDSWEWSSVRIEKDTLESRKSIMKILQELETHGLLERKRTNTGKMQYSFPQLSSPVPKAHSAETGQVSNTKNTNNTDKEYIIKYKDIAERYKITHISNFPDHKKEVNKYYSEDKWCKAIDELIRIDNYTRSEVLEVLGFVLKEDDFWPHVLLSLGTLRSKKGNDDMTKFEKIKAKMVQAKFKRQKEEEDENTESPNEALERMRSNKGGN